jgi:hypothetical protein
MKAIYIQDEKNGLLDFDLKDVLAAIGPRAVVSNWTISRVEGHEDYGVDATGAAANELEAVAQAKTTVSGSRLVELAHGVQQIIWGKFSAYEVTAAEPWLIVTAFDSSRFEVCSNDEATLALLRTAFRDVRSVD